MAFEARLTDAEIELLVYLHETVEGFTAGFAIRIEKVGRELDASQPDLIRNASFLVGHGLAGFAMSAGDAFVLPRPGAPRDRVNELAEVDLARHRRPGPGSGIWLSHLGETFVREIEATPSVPARLTRATLAASLDAVRGGARVALTELMKIGLRSQLTA